MFASIVTLSLAFAAVASAQADTPIIQTPASLVVCQPAALTWTGGVPPYFISVLPGGQPSATPLEQFPEQTGNTLTWTVDLAAGQNISLEVKDSTGATNFSDQVAIIAGVSTSCLNAAAASGASAGSSTSAAAAASVPSAPAAGATAGSSSASVPARASSAGSASSSSGSTSKSSSASSASATTSSTTSGADKLAMSGFALVGSFVFSALFA